MGYLDIDGQRVYGRNFAYGSFGPTDIDRKTYKHNKKFLEEAVYTKEILEEKFGGEFPNISFKLSELRELPWDIVSELARLIGMTCHVRRKHLMTKREIRALFIAMKNLIGGKDGSSR